MKNPINDVRLKKSMKKQKDNMDENIKICNLLFQTQDFSFFKGQFLKDLSSSINLLIEYSEHETDPIKYMLKTKEILIKIKTLKKFINTVESNSKQYDKQKG